MASTTTRPARPRTFASGGLAFGPVARVLAPALAVLVPLTVPPASAQVPEPEGMPDPVQIVETLLSVDGERKGRVENYTLVVKPHPAPVPLVQYFERVPGTNYFLQVPQSELEEREAAESGRPSARQLLGGMADALDRIGGPAGRVATVLRDGADPPGFAAVGNPAVDALDLRVFAERARIVDVTSIPFRDGPFREGDPTALGRSVVVLAADDLTDVPLEQSQTGPRYMLDTARLWVDTTLHLVLRTRVEMVAERGPSVVIDRVYDDFRSVGGMLLPFRVTDTMVRGGSEFEMETVTLIARVDEGPPTAQRQAELMQEALRGRTN